MICWLVSGKKIVDIIEQRDFTPDIHYIKDQPIGEKRLFIFSHWMFEKEWASYKEKKERK